MASRKVTFFRFPGLTTWERIHGPQASYPLITLGEDPWVGAVSLSSDLSRAVIVLAEKRMEHFTWVLRSY